MDTDIRPTWRATALILGGLALVAPVEASELPRVHVLATGGTIAGAQANSAGHAYVAGKLDVDALVRAAPNLGAVAVLTGEQVVSIGSQDMNDLVWLELARRVEAALARADVDAVLITHGTDTLEETSYFLSLVTQSAKPVVMVGAVRPATSVSADGPGNLQDGVAVAVDPRARARGVLVCMNDEIHYARNVVKTDTTRLQTFRSLNRGPAGLAHTGRIDWFEPMDRRVGAGSEFSITGLTALPRVDVVYAHAGMNADLIEAAIRNGARGIVVAGVGDGNMSAAALDVLARAARNGVAIVRSTRLPMGIVLRNSEVDDDRLGFVASGELNPAKSRVLLQLALTKTTDPARIQQMFDEY